MYILAMTLLAIMAAFGKYLDERRKQAIKEALEISSREAIQTKESHTREMADITARMNHLEADMSRLKDGCKQSTGKILKALRLPAAEHDARCALLEEAILLIS